MRRQTRALGTKVYEVKYRQININIGSPGHRTSDVYVYSRMRVGFLMGLLNLIDLVFFEVFGN